MSQYNLKHKCIGNIQKKKIHAVLGYFLFERFVDSIFTFEKNEKVTMPDNRHLFNVTIFPA